MSSSRSGAKGTMLRVGCASLAVSLFMPLATLEAGAQSERRAQVERRAKANPRPAPEQAKPLKIEGPLLSLVSLNQQRMYVYDANGLVTQTRISSGRTGHETPKGIYSILEKKVFHESNIYLGAKMPHMQRLTMTGIALHGGVIPGYPASGGCVRLPFDFARRFFDLTSINQRVVIVPDVNAPVSFEHDFLFSSLPSATRAAATGTKIGVDVAEALIGVSPAHAAIEPTVRTLESAAEERRAERQHLVDAIDRAAERRVAAAEGEKAAVQAVADARSAAKEARAEAGKLAREASKARAAIKSQERKIRGVEARLKKDATKLRADALEALRADEAAESARIAPMTEEAQQAAEAADRAAEAAKAAEKAVAEALERVKAAKAEIKEAAQAETAAKKAVVTFDRQDANRNLPVSVFISSATGMVRVRQGFEQVMQAQASIENPDVPLDTFVFTALGWKDDSQTALNWSATEVNEHSTRMSSFEDTGSRKKKTAETVKLPPETDADKARRTLDRIRIPREAADRIAEVVKPGSTLIVSSYDTAKSEMRYAGTDFVVQMPEVVAKITRPTPRPRPAETFVESGGGGFFFFGSPPPPPRAKRRVGSSRGVW